MVDCALRSHAATLILRRCSTTTNVALQQRGAHFRQDMNGTTTTAAFMKLALYLNRTEDPIFLTTLRLNLRLEILSCRICRLYCKILPNTFQPQAILHKL